jgi:hypothetical protein
MHSRAGRPERCLNKTDRALGRDGCNKISQALESPAPQLIGTSRRRTISAGEVDHGQERERWNTAGRRGATTRVWRSGARPRRQDVTTEEDGGGAAVAARGGPWNWSRAPSA